MQSNITVIQMPTNQRQVSKPSEKPMVDKPLTNLSN